MESRILLRCSQWRVFDLTSCLAICTVMCAAVPARAARSLQVSTTAEVWCQRTRVLADYGSDPFTATSSVAAADGGVLFVGNLQDEDEILALMVDRYGSILWARELSSPGQSEVSAVRRTQDGGFILAGSSSFFGMGDLDGLVIKLSGDGRSLWQRTCGSTGRDKFYGVTTTPDGGCVAVGRVGMNGYEDHPWVAKFSPTGELAWERTYDTPVFGSTFAGHMTAVDEASDGSLYVTGIAGSGYQWGVLLKLTQDGSVVWGRDMRAQPGDLLLSPTSVRATVDLGCVVVGDRSSYEQGAWLMRLDRDGGVIWNRSQSGCRFAEVGITTDGGYVIVGGSRDPSTDADSALLERIDVDGYPTWTVAFGGRNPGDYAFADIDRAYSVTETPDGYCLAARTLYGIFIMKLRPDGTGCYPAEYSISRPVVDVPALYDLVFQPTKATGSRDLPAGLVSTDRVVSVEGVCNTDSEGPVITRIAKGRRLPRSTATILGSGFSPRRTKNRVYFGRRRIPVTTATASSLSVVLPKTSDLVGVYVLVNGRRSNVFPLYIGD